jgi:hypothetical protein
MASNDFDPFSPEFDFENTAEWRRNKAIEYPNDKRNWSAAEILDRLTATVADVDAATRSAYDNLFDTEDDDAIFYAVEQKSEALRAVGFRSFPQAAAEFMQGLIDDVTHARA